MIKSSPALFYKVMYYSMYYVLCTENSVTSNSKYTKALLKKKKLNLFPLLDQAWWQSSFDQRDAITSQLSHFNFNPSVQVFLTH